MISTAATSGLGIVYWFVAARSYPPDVVGRNSAVIAAMLFLSGAATLFLDGTLVRFLPRAGKDTSRLIVYAYLVSAVTAAVMATIFLFGIQIWSPALGFLKNDPKLFLGFVVGTTMICIFSEQDGVLTGLRQAPWVPIENSTYAVLKIALLLVFAKMLPLYGIFASWIIPAGVLIICISLLIFLKLSPKNLRETSAIKEPLKVSQITRYAAANYFGFLFYTAYLMLPPIIVLQLAGERASAYFYLPWIIANSLRLFTSNMSNSLVVEGVRERNNAVDYFKKSLVNMMRLLIPLVAILYLTGPLILKLFGKDYSTEGISLMRLLLLGTFPGAVVTLYIGLTRILNRISQTILIQGMVAILMLAISYIFLPKLGITGVGWAYIISQSIVFVLISATQYKSLFGKLKAISRVKTQEVTSAEK